MITCNHCGIQKVVEDFGIRRREASGRCGTCRACINAEAKRKRTEHPEQTRAYKQKYYTAHRAEASARYAVYYAAHREQISVRGKKYRAANRELIAAKARAWQASGYYVWRAANVEKLKADNRAYRLANLERYRARKHAYYVANRARTLNSIRAWREANPERYRAIRQRIDSLRRMRVSNASEVINRIEVFNRDRWRCHLCGVSTKRFLGIQHPRAPELDHIIPLAAGGAHTWENVSCACSKCNKSKSARPLGQLHLIGAVKLHGIRGDR